MRSLAATLAALSLAGALLAAATPAVPGGPPVVLVAANAATSVWDTDPSKVGIELQIVNDGSAPATDVRVTAVDVHGGALAAAHSALPISLGNIVPQRSALLDLVITVPRTDGATSYLLTISGTYRTSGARQAFSLTHTVAPNAAAPRPIPAKSGASATTPTQSAGPMEPHVAGGPPSLKPNATTPMLIPPGPPRQLSPPNTSGTNRPTQERW